VERTRGFETRLRELHERPLIIPLKNFVPEEGEDYFVVPITPQKAVLKEFFKKTCHVQFSRPIHPIASVTRYTKIEQGVFVGAKSVIGTGTIFRDYVFVENGAVVATGAVVIRDVKERTLVAGTSAIIKNIYEH